MIHIVFDIHKGMPGFVCDDLGSIERLATGNDGKSIEKL